MPEHARAYTRLDAVNVGDFEIWGIEDLDSRIEDVIGRFLAGGLAIILIFVGTPLAALAILIVRTIRRKRQNHERPEKNMPLSSFFF